MNYLESSSSSEHGSESSAESPAKTSKEQEENGFTLNTNKGNRKRKAGSALLLMSRNQASDHSITSAHSSDASGELNVPLLKLWGLISSTDGSNTSTSNLVEASREVVGAMIGYDNYTNSPEDCTTEYHYTSTPPSNKPTKGRSKYAGTKARPNATPAGPEDFPSLDIAAKAMTLGILWGVGHSIGAPVDTAVTKRSRNTSRPGAPGSTSNLEEVENDVKAFLSNVAIRESSPVALSLGVAAWAAVNAPNCAGVTPLILASQEGEADIVRALLEHGASPIEASEIGSAALIMASHLGHRDIVDLLLRHGAMVEQTNNKGATALMRASQEGHDDIVRLLLKYGADVNRKNRKEMSSLMLASQRGHSSVVRILIEAGAEIDEKTTHDSTSLMLACKGNHVEAVKVLVASGCELMHRDSRGRTARDMAQRKGFTELLRILTPETQVALMKRESRIERNYLIAKLWTLLQQGRAQVIVPPSTGCHPRPESPDGRARVMAIHNIVAEVDCPATMRQWRRALIQAMSLPAPLVENIASFLPLPHLWDKRLASLVNQCHIDPDCTLTCTFDMIDEVLEDGGFMEACDRSGISPPSSFDNWAEWKAWGRKCDTCTHHSIASPHSDGDSEGSDSSQGKNSSTESGTRALVAHQFFCIGCKRQKISATCPRPVATTLELRRSVCFLQLLAHGSQMLARILAAPPYNMPPMLIEQLKNVNDIQSVVRKMGSRGVHFEVGVAMKLVMLASQVILWHQSQNANE